MYWKTKMRIKDAAAVSLVTMPVAYLAHRASGSKGAFRRAGRNAVIGASAAGAMAGAYGFTRFKVDPDPRHEDRALEETADYGGSFAAAAGLASGIASLVWDAIRAKRH